MGYKLSNDKKGLIKYINTFELGTPKVMDSYCYHIHSGELTFKEKLIRYFLLLIRK